MTVVHDNLRTVVVDVSSAILTVEECCGSVPLLFLVVWMTIEGQSDLDST